MRREKFIWLAFLLFLSTAKTMAAKPNVNEPMSPTEVLSNIQKAAPEFEKLLAGLRSADAAMRQSTMSVMVESNNASLTSSAINEARASSDPTLRDLAVRAAFREIAQFVPEAVSKLSEDATKAYVYFSVAEDSLKIHIEKYSWVDGKFSTKSGATGQVSSGQLSFASRLCQGKFLAIAGTWSYEGMVTCKYNALELNEKMRVHIR
jgi:hypothetical protein